MRRWRARLDIFELQDVIENLNAKLIRRHPHVFADRAGVENADQVLANWEEIKKSERAETRRVQQNLPCWMQCRATCPR